MKDDVAGRVAHRPQWKPYWPPNVWWLAGLAIAGGLQALMFVSLVMNVGQGDLRGVLASAFTALFLYVPARSAWRRAGMPRAGVPRTVGQTYSGVHGPGLLVRPTPVWSSVFAVAVCAVAIAATSGAAYPIACAMFGVVGVMLVQKRTEVALHADGIVRHTIGRGVSGTARTEEFLAWENVSGVKAGSAEVTSAAWYTVRHPVIRLLSNALDPSRRLLPSDKPDSIALRTSELGADSNALMALVLWCVEHPWARSSLVGDDARALLEVPPLRERLRLSWGSSQTGG